MTKTVEQLEAVLPLTVGDVTFVKLEEPTLLYFKLDGDNTLQYFDWMDQDQEWSSLENLTEEDYTEVIDKVNGAIQASNLKEEVLKPWYFQQ